MDRIATLLASAALIAFAGAAHAQVPKGFTPQSADAQRLENDKSLSSAHFQTGVGAMHAKNFQVAEGIFGDILRQNPNHADANFMMGVTKMSLNKWDDAKKYLEVSVKKKPKDPDPKSRLGVTLAKLGDVEGAMQQRAALEKMDTDCKGKCRNAQWITNGLAMIDAALPPKS